MAFSAFPSPLTLEQANKLKVGDLVDHKHRGPWAGRMVLAQIVQKNGSKLQLRYVGWSFNGTGEQFITKSDYSQELHRFYPPSSISKRKAHRFEKNVDFKKGDFVDININNSGWQVGRIQNMYGFQFGISFKGDDNAHKKHYVHIDNAKEFNLFGTRTKKIYSEMVPLWLKTRSNAKFITNKTAQKINNQIIKSVFGGALHLMDFIINNSNQSCLRKINEIIVKEKEKEKIKTKKNIKSREINDSNEEDKSKRYMTRSVARAKKTAKNVTKKIKQSNKKVEKIIKIYSFLDIQCNSLLAHICSFLLKSDLSVFKYASTAVCIVCMDELEKLEVGVLNMNTFIENVAVSNRNYLDIKEFQCLFTISRYPAYIKYKRLYQIFDDKYGIPQQYQLIYTNIDVYNIKNRFIAEVSKNSDQRKFLLFDKRNTIMFNDENKPIVMTENINVIKKCNSKMKFIVLKWFDIFHQKIKVIQFLYVQPAKITIQTLVKYVESQFIATTNKQSDWYTRKIESYLLEMDDECVVRFPQPKLIIHRERFPGGTGGIKLLDNMNQKCCSAPYGCLYSYIVQINPNHPYWSKSKFCTLQEKYNLM